MSGAACRWRSCCVLFSVCRWAATRSRTEVDEDCLSLSGPSSSSSSFHSSMSRSSCIHATMSLPAWRTLQCCWALIGLFLYAGRPVRSLASCLLNFLFLFLFLFRPFLFPRTVARREPKFIAKVLKGPTAPEHNTSRLEEPPGEFLDVN